MKKGLIAVLAVVALFASEVVAQTSGDYISVLRSQAKTDKKAVIAAAMQFDEKQSAAFWPIYREYENKRAELGDKRIALIEAYARNYKTMNDDKAKELLIEALTLREKRNQLQEAYVRKVEKQISPTTAARFLQIENQLQLLVDLSIAQKLPLVKNKG